MSSEYILAIDNGTQSVRALVFDLKGNLIAKKRVPIQPYYSTQPVCIPHWLILQINKFSRVEDGLGIDLFDAAANECHSERPFFFL